jgi:hypothetical protein
LLGILKNEDKPSCIMMPQNIHTPQTDCQGTSALRQTDSPLLSGNESAFLWTVKPNTPRLLPYKKNGLGVDGMKKTAIGFLPF